MSKVLNSTLYLACQKAQNQPILASKNTQKGYERTGDALSDGKESYLKNI